MRQFRIRYFSNRGQIQTRKHFFSKWKTIAYYDNIALSDLYKELKEYKSNRKKIPSVEYYY